MNIPNALTLARIVLVPLIVWLIISHEMAAAFVLFLLAGLSDAADGDLAKRFGWDTELGTYLDPIADKALLVSIYVTLGFTNHLPVWLVIAVFSRDTPFGAFILSWILSGPVTVYPLLVSKANTLAQFVLASLVLAELGFDLKLQPFVTVCIWVTGALTILSATAHFWGWLRQWQVMSFSLRRYRRARAIVSRSRPARFRGSGPRGPAAASPLLMARRISASRELRREGN